MRPYLLRPAAVVALVAAIVAVLALPTVASASRGQSAPGRSRPSRFQHAFHHALSRIDLALRVAIEIAPSELTTSLSASETVCGLGAQSEQAGDASRAGADWVTLAQLVEKRDQPAVADIDSALRRADLGLRELRERFSGGWRDRAKAARLRHGVAATRRGTRMLRAAVAQIASSFDSWSAHQCVPATERIARGGARAQAAAARIGFGMRPLWLLG